MKKASKPRKSNHVARPSGLTQSKDGKYIYAKCVISGNPTFFKPDYFATVLARFGGDENRMAREYVCKLVKDFRKRGFTDEQIRSLAAKGEFVKPEKIEKAEKVKTPRQPRVKGVVEQVVTKDAAGKAAVESRIVYPWTDNPNYFKTTPGVIDWVEASKDTCFLPNVYLDRQCDECPLYGKCSWKGKITDEKRAEASKAAKWRPKIKKIVWGPVEEAVVAE